MDGTLALTNARIFIQQPGRPTAHSVMVSHGRIVSIDKPPTRDASVIDVDGRCVVPGLIDAHMHMLNGGLSLQQLDLSNITSRTQFEQAITRWHRALPGDAWLVAHGWSSENWGGDDPNLTWFGEMRNRPIVCHRMDHHAVLVNSAVLKQLDLAAEVPGGRILRDDCGAPTGLLVEAAAWKLVNPIIPQPSAHEKQQALLAAQAHCHALGLTAVGSMEYTANVHQVFEPLRDQLSMRCRITLLDRDWPLDLADGEALRNRNDDVLAIIGYKSFLDGTLGSRSAWLLEDYSDDAGNRGLMLEHARDGHLKEWARYVAAHGFSPSMHAIGDAAARLALDVVDELDLRADGKPEAARIEHAQQLDPSDIARFRNVIASMQPLHLCDDGRYAARRLGQRRLAGSFAFRSLRNAGALLAFGSDWPIVSADPLAGIRAAVNGLTSEGEQFLIGETISVPEALHAYTAGAAQILQMPDSGTIRVGGLGDLIVLDSDPMTTDWSNAMPRVVMTIVGGRVVYDAM